MANESVARALEDLKVGLSESFHDTDLDLLRLNRLDSRQNLEAVSRETLQNFKLHDVLIDLIIKAQIQGNTLTFTKCRLPACVWLDFQIISLFKILHP